MSRVVISPSGKEISRVVINNQKIDVEVADSPGERETGLMYKYSLKENHGMLFIFEEEGLHNIWMKNTYIPLDIIWIDKDWIIVSIVENALPCKAEPCPVYSSAKKSSYILELGASSIEKLNIITGDTITVEK